MQGDLADGVVPTFDIAKTTPGELTIMPGRSWWVDGTRAFYLYKPVVGDFVVTARLHVTGRDAAVPAADWSLSGLLVRRPTDNRAQENWVSFRIGRRGGKDVFERKTTVAGTSTLVLTPAQPTWVELRIARVGRYFILLRRYGSGPFTTHFTYVRRDLPLTSPRGSTPSRATGTRRPTSSRTWTGSIFPRPACPARFAAPCSPASARRPRLLATSADELRRSGRLRYDHIGKEQEDVEHLAAGQGDRAGVRPGQGDRVLHGQARVLAHRDVPYGEDDRWVEVAALQGGPAIALTRGMGEFPGPSGDRDRAVTFSRTRTLRTPN